MQIGFPSMLSFLKNGLSLSDLGLLAEYLNETTYTRKELLDLATHVSCSNHSIELLKDISFHRRPKINSRILRKDIAASLEAQKLFSSLGKRGFSYRLVRRFSGFSRNLAGSVNFRFALMTHPHLYYPKRIRNFLKSGKSRNHIYMENYPSIGFAIGKISERDLFLLNLQSDFQYRAPRFIQDFFRGWRQLLVLHISNFTSEKGLKLHILPSDRVLRTCHLRFRIPTSPPRSWLGLYEKTAKEQDLKLRQIDQAIDISIYPKQSPVLNSIFFS